MAMVYSIVMGASFKTAKTYAGLDISKNTWTKYSKDVGLVFGERLERDRRDELNRYSLAQIDETAFGKRLSFFNSLSKSDTYIQGALFSKI